MTDMVREAVTPLLEESPARRMFLHGEQTLSDAELVSLITDAPMEAARQMAAHGVRGLAARDWRLGSRDKKSVKYATRMAAALELGRRIAGQAWSEPSPVRSPDDLARGLMARYGSKMQEHFVCVFLNAKNHVLCERVIYVGTLNSCAVSTREPIAMALQLNAAAMIVCHNHPSQDTFASAEDHTYTRKLADACKILGIDLHDHLIVTTNRYLSMRTCMDW